MPKPGEIKETESGIYVWSENGYWVKQEDPDKVKDRIPLCCPSCNELIDNWSSSYYNRWGVCSNCYYDFLHGRENLPEFNSNFDRSAYCKQKFVEKRKK